MAKISKPDANPIVAALLCFILNLGHFVINGQKTKWLYTLIFFIIPCCNIMWAVISAIDAYKTAEKLKAGKEIDENEYSFELFYKIAKIIHKDAVYVP